MNFFEKNGVRDIIWVQEPDLLYLHHISMPVAGHWLTTNINFLCNNISLFLNRQTHRRWRNHTSRLNRSRHCTRFRAFCRRLSRCQHLWWPRQPGCYLWCLHWWQHHSLPWNPLLDCPAPWLNSCLPFASLLHRWPRHWHLWSHWNW